MSLELSKLLHGCVLIKGIKADDKGVRLYIIDIIDLKDVKTKKNKKTGKGGGFIQMAILDKQPNIVMQDEYGRLVAKKFHSTDKIWKDVMGITNYSVVLNKNKTPFWWKTMEMSIPETLIKLSNEIDSLGIYIPKIQ